MLQAPDGWDMLVTRVGDDYEFVPCRVENGAMETMNKYRVQVIREDVLELMAQSYAEAHAQALATPGVIEIVRSNRVIVETVVDGLTVREE
jgi:hypothetical protein